jgi:hypothetical protein
VVNVLNAIKRKSWLKLHALKKRLIAKIKIQVEFAAIV